MEEWLDFLTVFSPALLEGLPWKEEDAEIQAAFEQMWGDLRLGCTYFMRFGPGQHTEAQILTAQNHLRAYGAKSYEV